MDDNFLVRVSCMTFNHAPYIEDAMNGFCMQETTFPFICTIMDDASTDGEPEVIKKYLQEHFDLVNKAIVRNEETDDYVMTFAQHKTNKNCYFAVYYLKYNHYSIKKAKMPYMKEFQDQVKYIAICEGDDYWIHPKKLQMQVEFLEKNKDYSFCFTDAIKLWQNNGKRELFAHLESRQYKPKELIINWLNPTASMMYRRSIIEELDIDWRKIIYGDAFLRMRCLHAGKAYGFSDPTCIYRKHEGGMVYTRSKSDILRFIQQLQYSQILFPEFRGFLFSPISKNWFEVMVYDWRNHHYLNMGISMWRSIFVSPLTFMRCLINWIILKIK